MFLFSFSPRREAPTSSASLPNMSKASNQEQSSLYSYFREILNNLYRNEDAIPHYKLLLICYSRKKLFLWLRAAKCRTMCYPVLFFSFCSKMLLDMYMLPCQLKYQKNSSLQTQRDSLQRHLPGCLYISDELVCNHSFYLG